jgi:hypothetical protein
MSMLKAFALIIFLMVVMLVSQSGVQMQKVTATPSPGTQREDAQATLEVLQTQIANIEATITALDASPDPIENEDEWRILEGEGFSLRAPISWISMDMDTQTLIDQFDQLESTTFDFEAMSQYVEMLGDALVLFAINVDYSTFDFATNMNVAAVDLGISYPLSFVVESGVQQMTSQVRSIEGEVIDLNGEEVGRVYTELDINGMNVRQVQFYFIRSNMLYIITFTTTKNLFEELEEEFFQIAETLTIED